jgi:hypothetical protein
MVVRAVMIAGACGVCVLCVCVWLGSWQGKCWGSSCLVPCHSVALVPIPLLPLALLRFVVRTPLVGMVGLTAAC